MIPFLKEASLVHPTPEQLSWYEMETYAFVHFGMNTFTDREWGDGTESETLFAPSNLDTDQWARVFRNAGLKGMVLTAKHHDGFCLWPSQYTEHSIKKSPLSGRDVVKEAALSCQKYGLKFGFYLSPWDRNSALYGTDAYNDYFCHQLTELLTQYGEIFYVWFDNACGEGPNGKKQQYDFPRFFQLIRKLQPKALIFNDFGPDIRWCGNEAGKARREEWAVVPEDLCYYSPCQTGPGPLASEGSLQYLYNTNESIGSLNTIFYAKGLSFTPSEMDTSIRKGWFYHSEESPKSKEELFRIYLSSVGHNACLNLNIPPNREGKIDEKDVRRLLEWRQLIEEQFHSPISYTVTEDHRYPTQPVYHLNFDHPVDLRYVVLREDIAKGQRIESFRITALEEEKQQFPLYEGYTVGNREICAIKDPFAHQNPMLRQEKKVSSLEIRITSARGKVKLKEIACY